MTGPTSQRAPRSLSLIPSSEVHSSVRPLIPARSLRRQGGGGSGSSPLLLIVVSAALLSACAPECGGAYLGHSNNAPLLTTSWPSGTGSAAGAWKVTLTPNSFGTNCVSLSDGSFPSETYAYTLVFPEGVNADYALYAEGVLLATGAYTDEPSEVDTPDGLEYHTGERLTSDRDGGDITWQIQGYAQLEANRRSGSLTWSGSETITVLESQDPAIVPGCTFTYDVTGYKLCDE